MKRFLAFLLSLFSLKSTAQTPAELVEKYGKKFPKHTELSIALIHGDEVTFYGFIKKDSSFQSIDNASSIFEIGSITKVFTASLLAHEVSQNKIKLSQLVKKSLPFKLKGNPKITLQHLANHTSGLPRLPDNLIPMATNQPDNPYKGYTAQKLKEYCTKQLSLNKAIGTYEYSNLGAGLLGYALSQESGKSYEEMLQETIFSPLGMEHSTTNRALVGAKLVKGLDPLGAVTSNWDMDVLAPAGSILSSTQDLSKFAIANFDSNQKAFVLQQSQTATVGGRMSMALGWHIIKARKGNTYHWHNGGTGGYSSSMTLDIHQKLGVIVLSNLSAFHPKMGNIDVLGFELMKQLAKATAQEKN